MQDITAPSPDAVSESKAESEAFVASDAINGILSLIEKSVKHKETRLLMGRLLRQTAVLRKHLDKKVLRTLVNSCVPVASPAHGYLLGAIQEEDEMDEGNDTMAAVKEPSLLPEMEMYAYLLVLMFLLDHKQYKEGRLVADAAVERLKEFNRRTMDVIAARIYFYYSWAYECTGALADVRSALMAAHRTAVLRHDAVGQETLLNLLLRSYLNYNLYDQAEKFRAKSQKSDQWRSPQQYCRYLYYLGRIRAIQLEYTEAKEVLQQAARKAPSGAQGFRVACSKWLILVRLLLGEIPERVEFSTPGMRAPLQPYFELTTAVRSGDLATFQTVTEKYRAVFQEDKTINLITRLHHNVIRTGLRRINLAYSRISLKDVAEKLHLPSAEDAEFICAKAIRDGALDAVLDHAGAFLASREVADVYSTQEPQTAFHARIAFCLDIHNEAVKAMRFEPDAHRAALETAEGRKERLAAEKELADAMEEDDDGF